MAKAFIIFLLSIALWLFFTWGIVVAALAPYFAQIKAALDLLGL